MSRLESGLAYTWAVLATPVVLATFLGFPVFSRQLAERTGVSVSPWLVGGTVMREIVHPGYRTLVRRPVFDGLIAPRSAGFVQVEWQPLSGGGLPRQLLESIDYDQDGVADFDVALDVAEVRAQITPRTPRVIGLDRVYDVGPERVIRVRLRRR